MIFLIFWKQSLNLIDLFSFYYPKKPVIKILKSNIKDYYFLKNTIPEKINNQYYFDKSDNAIAFYDRNKDDFYSFLNFDNFKDKISTISLSLDKKNNIWIFKW